MDSYILDRKMVIKLKDNCEHCISIIDELNKLLTKYEEGGMPFRDFKLTIELTSDWIGEKVFHLNVVNLEEKQAYKNGN